MIITNPPGPFDPTWDSLSRYQVPEWYLDAKFGIFIHWGVYSVPAFGNEWYPRAMYQQGDWCYNHHRETYGPQDQFGYKDFIPMFTAEHYRPKEWVALFKEAGAQYVVPVAEHHDGFAMYRTRLSKWNAVEMGPKRDCIGELAQATRDAGLVFGLSSHRAEHWWFLNGGKAFASDVQDPAYADFYGPAQPDGSMPDETFLDDWLARCAELVDQYQPQVFWFDWWIEQPVFAPYLRRFGAYYYNRAFQWGKGVALNYKNEAYPPSAAVFDVERGQLASIRPHYWQTDTAVGKRSWSHIQGEEYKTPESLVHDLVDIVSKNGCLLLNIGPRADGTIPEEDQAILRFIGAWLRVNGEAVYGTRPYTVFGEGPTEVGEGSFKDTERAPFTPADLRFTTKNGALYVTVLADPGSEVRVRTLGAGLKVEPRTVARVELLGHEGDLPFEVQPDALVVTLPKGRTPVCALSLRVSFA